MGYGKNDLIGHVPFEFHHHDDVDATLECSRGSELITWCIHIYVCSSLGASSLYTVQASRLGMYGRVSKVEDGMFPFTNRRTQRAGWSCDYHSVCLFVGTSVTAYCIITSFRFIAMVTVMSFPGQACQSIVFVHLVEIEKTSRDGQQHLPHICTTSGGTSIVFTSPWKEEWCSVLHGQQEQYALTTGTEW